MTSRFILMGLWLPLLALVVFALPSWADSLSQIPVRKGTDWTISRTGGETVATVDTFTTHSARENGPIWEFRADCPDGEVNHDVSFRLYFSDFGIEPLQKEEIGYVRWSWRVFDREDSDRVKLHLVFADGSTDDGIFPFPASHKKHDYNEDVFLLGDRFESVHLTIDEMQEFYSGRNQSRPITGPVIGLELGISGPQDQVVWLGPIEFGPAAQGANYTPSLRAPRNPERHGMTAVDFDRDGNAEMFTPGRVGEKIWEFDAELDEYVRVAGKGFLSRGEPLRHAVVADLDQDGDLDVVAQNHSNFSLYVIENRAGNFVEERLITPQIEPGAYPRAISIGDDNDDGYPEIFLGYHEVSVDFIYRMEGKKGLQFSDPEVLASRDTTCMWGSYILHSLDIDGNGALDILASGTGLYWLPGNGDGTYASPESLICLNRNRAGHLRSVLVFDVDADSSQEVFVAIEDNSGLDYIDGSNYLLRTNPKLGEYDVTEEWNLTGTKATIRALVTSDSESGRPTLLIHEAGQGLFQSILPTRANATQAARSRKLLEAVEIPSGARDMAIVDNDHDGYPEIVFSTPDGPVVRNWDRAGPVVTVIPSGWGPKALNNGDVLNFGSWSVPLSGNGRDPRAGLLLQPGSSVVANGETFAVPNQPGLVFELRPKGTWLTPSSLGDWFQYRWPSAREENSGLLAATAIGGPAVVLIYALVLRRRKQAEQEKQAARDRIRQLIFDPDHTHLKTSFDALHIVLKPFEADPAETIVSPALRRECVEAFPKFHFSIWQKIHGQLIVADWNSAVPAEEAVQSISEIYEDRAITMGELLRSETSLRRCFYEVLSSLRGEHTTDVVLATERLAKKAQTHTKNRTTRIRCVEASEERMRTFPIPATDGESLLFEFLVNALKKSPAPEQIIVDVLEKKSNQGKKWQLSVFDTGHSIRVNDVEREGESKGLAKARVRATRLGGELCLVDVPTGGVSVTLEVPDSRRRTTS